MLREELNATIYWGLNYNFEKNNFAPFVCHQPRLPKLFFNLKLILWLMVKMLTVQH